MTMVVSMGLVLFVIIVAGNSARRKGKIPQNMYVVLVGFVLGLFLVAAALAVVPRFRA
ncbi:MAG: hypothetical protein ABI442_16550 [Gemmatimonadaceae bacterium]